MVRPEEIKLLWDINYLGRDCYDHHVFWIKYRDEFLFSGDWFDMTNYIDSIIGHSSDDSIDRLTNNYVDKNMNLGLIYLHFINTEDAMKFRLIMSL